MTVKKRYYLELVVDDSDIFETVVFRVLVLDDNGQLQHIANYRRHDYYDGPVTKKSTLSFGWTLESVDSSIDYITMIEILASIRAVT